MIFIDVRLWRFESGWSFGSVFKWYCWRILSAGWQGAQCFWHQQSLGQGTVQRVLLLYDLLTLWESCYAVFMCSVGERLAYVGLLADSVAKSHLDLWVGGHLASAHIHSSDPSELLQLLCQCTINITLAWLWWWLLWYFPLIWSLVVLERNAVVR